MNKKQISMGNLRITGYETDYILQTIEKNNDFYEGALLRKWTPFFSDAKYILDIGANLGNHTLFWATNLSVKKIISFEPFPDNFAVLSENIKNNALAQVQPLQMAVSDHVGNLIVKEFTAENYGATTFEHSDDSVGSEDTVLTCTIDSIFPELDMPALDFVKIDTEGFELSVLKGMSVIIEKYKPVLWIEVCEASTAEVYRTLCAMDYILADVTGANTLFVPQNRHVNSVSVERLLQENQALVSRVNKYYTNYETAKQWLAFAQEKQKQAEANYAKSKEWIQSRDTRIVKLTEEKTELAKSTNQLMEQLESNNNKLTSMQEENACIRELLESSNRKLTSIQEENVRMRELLVTSEHLLKEEEAFLGSVKQEFRKTKWKASRYDAIHNRLTGSWYGKIALVGYRTFKKIKGLLKRKNW